MGAARSRWTRGNRDDDGKGRWYTSDGDGRMMDLGGQMTANNKTNEAVHLQKTHPSSKGQNHAGGGATCHLPPH